MDTKWGITALVVGGYLLALGIAGINANSGGGAVAAFSVVLVVGFVLAGWAVLLPWSGAAHRIGESPEAIPVAQGGARSEVASNSATLASDAAKGSRSGQIPRV